MAPDGEIQTPNGWMTEYRIAWFHQQGAISATHQGLPFYTVRLGTPLPSERSQIYGMGCTHRAEVYCGPLWMVLACNYNHDDEVLFNPRVLIARLGPQEVIWDNRPDAHFDEVLNLKFHKARDDGGNRFVDLYMHIWVENQPVSVLIIGKKDDNNRRARLTNSERMKLGIPQWVWEASGEAHRDPRNDYMLNYAG